MELLGIFVIALIANSQDFLGSSFIGRPIVTGFLLGILFNNVEQGLILGATLEMIFMGMMGVGATVPPDEVLGGVLAIALALKNGYGPEIALTLALPIATLGMITKNLLYVGVFPAMVHKADSLASQGKLNRSADMHIIACLTRIILMSVVATVSYAVGSTVVESIVNAIPTVIVDGMNIATGLLPALGIAMLINMINSKRVFPFLILGFVLASYLGMDMISIALVGIVIGLVMYQILNEIGKNRMVTTNEDEF